jgi:hypothetical protein
MTKKIKPKTKNNILAALSTLIAVTLASTACVTGHSDKRPDGVVVERNKQARPAWVDSPTDRLLVSSTETRFHHALSKQRDLPIAVKQSQTLAIDASFRHWTSGFEHRLTDFPQIKGLRSSPRTSKDTEVILEGVSKKIHAEVAQIEDIYYEKIRIDNYSVSPELQGVTEYFDVHTLVQLLPVDTDRLRQTLGTALLAGKYPEMKKVGKELIPPKPQKSK